MSRPRVGPAVAGGRARSARRGSFPAARWQAGYNHEGRRHWGTFEAKADADAWLAQARTMIGRGEWVDPEAGRTTVAPLAESWLRSNSRKRSSTLARDEAIMRLHVLPAIGSGGSRQ